MRNILVVVSEVLPLLGYALLFNSYILLGTAHALPDSISEGRPDVARHRDRRLTINSFTVGSIDRSGGSSTSSHDALHHNHPHANLTSGREGRSRVGVCSSTEALTIGSLYHEMSGDRSHCPSEEILFDLRDNFFEFHNTTGTEIPAVHSEAGLANAVFVDVGFNKGYNYASWMAVFSPELDVTPSAWYQALQRTKTSVDSPCGVCDDCGAKKTYASKNPESKQKFKSIMLGVDLNSNNINLVSSIISKLDLKENALAAHTFINLTHAGASDANGFLDSPLDCHSGLELCSLSKSKVTSASGAIPVITLDSLFASYVATGQIRPRNLGPGVRYRPLVDVLMIDTEGNDAVVLSRAGRVLSERQARLVVFEYHGTCPWPKTPLIKVISMFNSHNYVCYFPGQEKRMWRITGCFTDLFDYHMWSNIYCVYKQDPWYTLFESHRVLPSVALERLVQMGKDKIKMREFPKQNCD